jgi:2-keto-4-pentenoate hydratase
MAQSQSDLDAISDALLAARQNCMRVDKFPGTLPATLDEAYACQQLSIAKWPSDLVGFKVGGIPPKFQKQYPSPWQVGPMFKDQMYHVASGESQYVTVYEHGFAAYEAEFVFAVSGLEKLTGPVKTIAEAKGFVSKVYLGAEIASSPNLNVNNLGPGSIISDFGNNAGVVVGPEAPLSLLDDISAMEVTLHIDGKEIGRKHPTDGEGGPLGALRHILNHFVTYKDELNLPETVLISSGAITGVHQSYAGTSSKIKFGELAEYELIMVPRRPTDLLA